MKRALGWLGALRRDEGGNALAIAAAVMPLILGASAMAIDSIELSLSKRQLQRAADSSAIAGARALAQLSETEKAEAAVGRDLDQNVHPTLAQAAAVAVGPSGGFNQTVRVSLTAQRTMPFVSFFRSQPVTVAVSATAAVVSEGTYCMVSLYDGTSAGINVNGTADVTLGCGMATNSRADSAVTAGGNSTITATPIAAVGGLDGDSNNFLSPTTLEPYSTTQEDPLAHLPDPPANPGGTHALDVKPGDPCTTVGAAGQTTHLSSMTIKGCVTLVGTIVVHGDVNLTSQAEVTGDGVTIVMTGPGGQAGDLTINGQAELNMTAPESGDYAGVLFFRDRRSSNDEIRINGGSDMTLRGALYFPTSDIFFAGAAGMNVQCLQMVGRILTFRGTAAITNNCPAGGASQAFERTLVRLIA